MNDLERKILFAAFSDELEKIASSRGETSPDELEKVAIFKKLIAAFGGAAEGAAKKVAKDAPELVSGPGMGGSLNSSFANNMVAKRGLKAGDGAAWAANRNAQQMANSGPRRTATTTGVGGQVGYLKKTHL